ncbi:ABC transporter permease [Mesorhizobium muleiense]|uniref:ABC transporter permease n=1 Tax=Mesorhizobium muleiense TaxID=1004279 RepID=UPI001EEBAF58|nr:ABC transporter permease subunit [Mesorhizobium muleiense]MCF6108475.1 ABC transporter permease subunit [Mesorhizobium muleiense]
MSHAAEYLPFVLSGIYVTVALSVCSLLVATVLGLIGAWGKSSSVSAARSMAETYTTLIRGIPDLVLMLLLYYGGQAVANQVGATTGLWSRMNLDPFTVAVFAIGVIFGSYMTETFRGAYLAIPRGQSEAGKALGLGRWQLFRLVIWPQLVRYALPSFSNNWLSLMKTTALASVMGLEDVVNKANAAGRATHQPFSFIVVVLLVYLAMTAASDVGLGILAKRLRASGAA